MFFPSPVPAALRGDVHRRRLAGGRSGSGRGDFSGPRERRSWGALPWHVALACHRREARLVDGHGKTVVDLAAEGRGEVGWVAQRVGLMRILDCRIF